MSALGILRPARLARLLACDAMNVGRDPTLLFAALLSVAPVVGLALGTEALDEFGRSVFGFAGLSRNVLPLVLTLPAAMIGWVTGFLFLEDRDDGPLLAHDVSPLGKGGFMLYRGAVAFLLTGAIALASCALLIPDNGLSRNVLISVLVGAEAVAAALVLPAIARNKVEGLALTKLTSLASLAPMLAALPSPWRYLGAVLPPYWIGELLGLSQDYALPAAVAVVLAGVCHLLAVTMLYRLNTRRPG